MWDYGIHGEFLLFVEVIDYKVSGAPLFSSPLSSLLSFLRKQYPIRYNYFWGIAVYWNSPLNPLKYISTNGRLAQRWLERRVDIAKVGGSNPPSPIFIGYYLYSFLSWFNGAFLFFAPYTGEVVFVIFRSGVLLRDSVWYTGHWLETELSAFFGFERDFSNSSCFGIQKKS